MREREKEAKKRKAAEGCPDIGDLFKKAREKGE